MQPWKDEGAEFRELLEEVVAADDSDQPCCVLSLVTLASSLPPSASAFYFPPSHFNTHSLFLPSVFLPQQRFFLSLIQV